MDRHARTSPVRTSLLLLAALTCALALAACGGDSDDTSGGGDGAVDPVAAAEDLAACTTEGGLEGTVTEPTIPDASAVDLTTKYQTILVAVFADVDAAADYENEPGLDQEVVDNYVIVGGTIKPAQRDLIIGCISG